jgi:hypothetical protein
MATRKCLPLVLSLLFCACFAASASAAGSARISALLAPEHLGSATTLTFGFAISDAGRAPPALSEIDVGYPSNLGFATSGLGVAPCPTAQLESLGQQACPANSRMGHGHAEVEIPIGPEIVHERVTIEVFAGPSPDGYLHVLAYVVGLYPIEARVVLSGVLLPGHLDIVMPPIPSLPFGPYVSVSYMRLVLGGHLTYYERVGGRNVAYHPAGVGLPRNCPHGGFPFTASFAFIDGRNSRAVTAVPCPRH